MQPDEHAVWPEQNRIADTVPAGGHKEYFVICNRFADGIGIIADAVALCS